MMTEEEIERRAVTAVRKLCMTFDLNVITFADAIRAVLDADSEQYKNQHAEPQRAFGMRSRDDEPGSAENSERLEASPDTWWPTSEEVATADEDVSVAPCSVCGGTLRRKDRNLGWHICRNCRRLQDELDDPPLKHVPFKPIGLRRSWDVGEDNLTEPERCIKELEKRTLSCCFCSLPFDSLAMLKSHSERCLEHPAGKERDQLRAELDAAETEIEKVWDELIPAREELATAKQDNARLALIGTKLEQEHDQRCNELATARAENEQRTVKLKELLPNVACSAGNFKCKYGNGWTSYLCPLHKDLEALCDPRNAINAQLVAEYNAQPATSTETVTEKGIAMAQVNDHGESIDDGTRQPLKDPGPEPPVDELLQRLNPHDRAAWTSTEPQPEKPDFRDLCDRLAGRLIACKSSYRHCGHYRLVDGCAECDLISEATEALAGGKGTK